MANQRYPKGREHFAEADINWLTDTIKVVLLSSAYSYSSAHEFLSDLSGSVATATLTGKAVTDGALTAASTLFSALTGSAVVAAVIYKDTGTAGTSPLIKFFDTGAGLPFTPNGTDFQIVWPTTGILIV